MKWFKHETTAHTSLKLEGVIEDLGLEAIGYYWCCLELVGLEGENFRIKSKKNWKNSLIRRLKIEPEKQEAYLTYFATATLIDKKALKSGDLYIPKLAERSDDYTKRVRRVYGQSTDNVRLEENRTDKKRIEQNREEETSGPDFKNKGTGGMDTVAKILQAKGIKVKTK